MNPLEFLLSLFQPHLISPMPQHPMSMDQATQQMVGQGWKDVTPQKSLPTPTATPMPSPTPPPDAGAKPYYQLINTSASENGIPQNILYNLLRTESMGFNPDVISGKLNSPVGAQGIAQFMPATAQGMGFNPLDPNQAIPKAAQYLKAKIDRHGSLANALASYNAGSGAVDKYGGIPPYKETIDYVNRILGSR